MNNYDLARQVKAWRGRVTARRAAEVLGIPHRTLENIEYGRGFRYERLLRHALRTMKPPKEGEK
jgi:hypothetical protein